MSAKYRLFSRVGNTRIIPMGLKILGIFISLILLSNFATNVISVQFSQNEILKLNNTIMVEQLKELGVSRSITVNDKDRSTEIKQKNADFWARFNARDDEAKPVVISEETKALLKANITKALTEKGYKVKKLELYPLEDNVSKYALRGVIRAYKPLKKKNNSYNEIQSILVEMKKICMEAAVIDGKCMLSELTTFDAEDSKNKLHYTKTLL